VIPHEAWPVDFAVLGPFLIAVALIELTPGPNMAWLAAVTVGSGRGAGLRAVAGITLGLCVYMAAAVAGVAGIVAAAPGVYGALRIAGVVYLLWLAWEAWRDATATPTPEDSAAPFWRGLVANLLNPKAMVFYVALLPGFIAPDHGEFWKQALVLGSLHIAVSVLVHSGIVLTADHAARLVGGAADVRKTARLRRAAAICIALVAIWILLESRR
jgi:threonine/homoserine/homoserine lactone efflux protein